MRCAVNSGPAQRVPRARAAAASPGPAWRLKAIAAFKLLILDGRLLVIGSMNLDLRSQLQNLRLPCSSAAGLVGTRHRANRSRPGRCRLACGQDSEGRLVWRAPRQRAERRHRRARHQRPTALAGAHSGLVCARPPAVSEKTFSALGLQLQGSNPAGDFALVGQRAHMFKRQLGLGVAAARQVEPLLEPPGALARLPARRTPAARTWPAGAAKSAHCTVSESPHGPHRPREWPGQAGSATAPRPSIRASQPDTARGNAGRLHRPDLAIGHHRNTHRVTHLRNQLPMGGRAVAICLIARMHHQPIAPPSCMACVFAHQQGVVKTQAHLWRTMGKWAGTPGARPPPQWQCAQAPAAGTAQWRLTTLAGQPKFRSMPSGCRPRAARHFRPCTGSDPAAAHALAHRPTCGCR